MIRDEIHRTIFDADHDRFRRVVRGFVDDHVVPELGRWAREGSVGRQIWRTAGGLGLLAPDVDECYGGGGHRDYRYHAIRAEEMAWAGALYPVFTVHCEVVAGYLSTLGTAEQKRRWLPALARGDEIFAIAISEPAAGSDVAAMTTTARPDANGYVVRGQKTFVTHGLLADHIVVAARMTGHAGDRAFGLFVVDVDRRGVRRGRPVPKAGLSAVDTVELFLDDVRLPRSHLLGEPGLGLAYLSSGLPRERLSIAVSALAFGERLFGDALRHCRTAGAGAAPAIEQQHVRFEIAEMGTALRVARAFTDRCIAGYDDPAGAIEDTAMAKWWNTELCLRVADRCLQLRGSDDGSVVRSLVDARAQTIYGGTTEIMKEIIGHSFA